MQRLFISILNLLSRLSHKHIVYINKEKLNPARFATFTDYGFWFCGNIFDYADIAYGFASTGKIEAGEMDAVHSMIMSVAKSGYVFYDIGSNTGPYSLLAASSRDDCIVHSFDPVPEHLRILHHSVRLNGFEERIFLHETALSDHSGRATLTLSGTGSSLERNFLTDKEKPTLDVHLSDLDSYKDDHNLENPDFIKIDVEGHEMQVVRGAIKIIKHSRPILFIEVARHLTDSGRKFHNDQYEKFFKLLTDIGYEAFRWDKMGFLPFSPSFEKPGAYMYLFLHKETHMEDHSLRRIIHI